MSVSGMPTRGGRENTLRNSILTDWRLSMRKRGFEEISTPALYPISTLRKSGGGENLALMYEIMKRGLEPGEAIMPSAATDMALRYDLTVPLMEYWKDNRASLPPVFKAYQTGLVWRAEKAQKGRYRQFQQFDMDIIGINGVDAEIEILLSMWRIQGTKTTNMSFKINDRKWLESTLTDFGYTDKEIPQVMRFLDKMDKLTPDEVADLIEGSIKNPDANEDLREHINKEFPVPENIKKIKHAVESFSGANTVTFSPWLARGLDYYTGIVFEAVSKRADGSTVTVGGGGRYDNVFIDQPCVGGSIGFDRWYDVWAEDYYSMATSGKPKKLAIVYDQDVDFHDVIAHQAKELSAYDTVTVEPIRKNRDAQEDNLRERGYSQMCRISSRGNHGVVNLL